MLADVIVLALPNFQKLFVFVFPQVVIRERKKTGLDLVKDKKSRLNMEGKINLHKRQCYYKTIFHKKLVRFSKKYAIKPIIKFTSFLRTAFLRPFEALIPAGSSAIKKS